MASKQKDFLAEVAKQQQKRRPVKLMSGLVAGTIAGLAATWVLDRYKEGAVAVTRRAEEAAGSDSSFSQQQAEQISSHHMVHKEAAQFLAQFTVGKRLTSQQQKKAGLCIHYAVGALTGALYGLTAEWLPVVRSGYGTGFSSILFLGGSEALLPWLDQGKTQRRMPPALKVSGLSSHLIYGGVLETVRRAVRFIL